MSVNLGGWIHSFAVTETDHHKKGYTIYKITSIVFPRSVPEALTCITVWKRFREIKRLYRDLAKRQKSLHLRGQIPESKEPGLFKRFEPEVIAKRKDYILQLLDYAAQHPALYKSQPFLSFFETGSQIVSSPATPSPLHSKGNIENICDNLDLPFQSPFQIDSSKNSGKEDSLNTTLFSNAGENRSTEDAVDESEATNDCSVEEDASSICSVLQLNIPIDNDYIYEAAYEFSRAVQAEVNQDYKEAFRRYNIGIEKLLDGSKDDENDDRRVIAKTKVAKYMARSQEIFEQHLLFDTDNNKKALHLSVDTVDSNREVYLERPWNQLSKFKVIQVIDTVMQVQDVTDKRSYIMKTIQKPSTNTNSHSIFLPQNVPHMVELVGFFQSDSTIFLLIQHAKGGKLFDYIKTYTPTTGHVAKSLSEIFFDFEECGKAAEVPATIQDSTSTTINDSGFMELLSEYERQKIEDSESKLPEPEIKSQDEDVSAKTGPTYEMDINDLVSCSQKLLQSVSNTLDQFRDVGLEKSKPVVDETAIIAPKTPKTEVEVFFENNAVPPSPIKATPPNRNVVLPEVIIKQWARELIIAIESLHRKGIVLGDLHTRNILLGSNGQLFLSYFYQCAGFDSASQIAVDPRALEEMFVAPERPLTTKSDWWSFGLILFELLTGYTYRSCHPAGFGHYYEVQYPNVEITENAKDLLNGLLQQNASNRFQVDQIMAHEFFEGTAWDNIRRCGNNYY